MSGNNKQHMGQNKPKPKSPPLTHFLCLPLVNSISLPQLESSLASFKASIPPAFPSKSEQREQQQSALIPDAAIRPVGTLHLTLGVMSLPTPERLEEAMRFFHSLDLAALLRTAGENAAQKRLRVSTRKRDSTPIESIETSGDQQKTANMSTAPTDQSLASGSTEEPSQDDSGIPQPFTISLESLHALPRARSAAVLHASPVDPTSRLYPFCEALRDKFLGAGFLQGEYKSAPKKTPKNQESEETPAEPSKETTQRLNPPVATAPSKSPTSERKDKPKPRPLLLHATVVNTIYIRGRKRKPGVQGKKARNDRYTFDARDILSHYKNFYSDSERTIPRSGEGFIARREPDIPDHGNDEPDTQENPAAKENADAQSGKGEPASAQLPRNNDTKEAGYPFVWARNFPVETVCICEMGAKNLDPNADDSGMNARLGEKYTVVAERSLNSGTIELKTERNSMAESNDGSVEEGGVKVSA
ncbi:hypothetical protein ASPVEDRAFT_186021 [Aspergillus versicolor CBS 583.65]|uniref:A-kinase anchor protein 7-like phosphoesterase domain-containing protein n=1 Tax=Aspergillus versicolor CBS 583.65 TaxID=1036611 RepID=A0A1L9PAI5_ASPVE|nr:uncharacterized protein ASPVEDRAFT_186021 [Aspergillus versicolor CBS 583.65]OJI98516.1 hypothetical protein ASPVEDRAFT_186021 [Aspergillus versicolor CBS 583.65]